MVKLKTARRIADDTDGRNIVLRRARSRFRFGDRNRWRRRGVIGGYARIATGVDFHGTSCLLLGRYAKKFVASSYYYTA